MSERVYIIPYIPKAEITGFPYEYDEEEDEYKKKGKVMFKANIKEIKKQIDKMGKEEYLKQKRANRKGASTAYNESFSHLRNTMSQMRKFSSTEKNPSFSSRVNKKVKEMPGKVGFEITATTKNINISELVQGRAVPAKQKGVKVKNRKPLKLKIGKKIVKDKRRRFIGPSKSSVFIRRPGHFERSTMRSVARRLMSKKVESKITEKIVSQILKSLKIKKQKSV